MAGLDDSASLTRRGKERSPAAHMTRDIAECSRAETHVRVVNLSPPYLEPQWCQPCFLPISLNVALIF